MDSTRDVAGRTVRVGDIVGGTTSGRYQATITGPVTKLGVGKVKIAVGTSDHEFAASVGDPKWISTSRIFLIAPSADGLPPSGEWTPKGDATIRARVNEVMPTRHTDPVTHELLDQLTHLRALADAYRDDAQKLTRLELLLEPAHRKTYAPDMDQVAEIFGWEA
ncbi:hypothetical protein [Streptomyces sp. AD55]|uniref:hypothetical protein n=1 Tax=Streptomyces sp. AD55 TaxID=3242895 RepID=UPI003529989F